MASTAISSNLRCGICNDGLPFPPSAKGPDIVAWRHEKGLRVTHKGVVVHDCSEGTLPLGDGPPGIEAETGAATHAPGLTLGVGPGGDHATINGALQSLEP